jgi:hypothetical protein
MAAALVDFDHLSASTSRWFSVSEFLLHESDRFGRQSSQSLLTRVDSKPVRCAVHSGALQCFLGNRDRGLFGGASFFFDFQNVPVVATVID